MRKHSGPGAHLRQPGSGVEAIYAGAVQPGDVVVIRYEGPRGGPGHAGDARPTSAHHGDGAGRQGGADHRRALLAAGRAARASGTCPRRRRRGGPIARVREGDIIELDLEARTLNVRLSDDEIAARLAALPPFEPQIESQWLRRYAHFVTSADRRRDEATS